jgi:hypothetical protein
VKVTVAMLLPQEAVQLDHGFGLTAVQDKMLPTVLALLVTTMAQPLAVVAVLAQFVWNLCGEPAVVAYVHSKTDITAVAQVAILAVK